MKNLMRNLMMVLVVLSATTLIVKAQAWDRHTKVLSIGIGPSQFFHLDRYYYTDAPIPRIYYWPLTGQFNFQGEFGIHKYVGLGFTTGIGGRGPVNRNYLGELNIPVGMIANFHFYQLIADHASRNIHADKLDIYAGLNLGSGVAFSYYPDVVRAVPLAFGGVQAGIRYYFVPRVAVNGELGFGKSIANVGFTFKL